MFFSTTSLNPLKQIIIFTDSRIGTLRWSSFTHPVLVYPELAEGHTIYFRYYKKVSSSLWFQIKSPPSFSSSLLSWTLKTDHWTLLSWVVFYPENLLFWNPPQGKTAFFFFLFSFAKMCVKWSEAEFTNSYKKQ